MRQNRGFTAIVLLLSVLIIAILSVIIFQSLYGSSEEGEPGRIEQGIEAVDQAEQLKNQLDARALEQQEMVDSYE